MSQGHYTASVNISTLSELQGLSSGAHRLLIGLVTYRNRESGRCNPRIAKLSERMGGVPKRTVFRWMAELRSKGLVEVESRPGRSNFYTLRSCGTGSSTKTGEVPSPAPGGSAKSGTGVVPKVARVTRAKNGTQAARHPYMNQTTFFEQTERTDAAAVDTPTYIGEPKTEEKTAAAVPPLPTQKSAEGADKAPPPATRVQTGTAESDKGQALPPAPPDAVAELAQAMATEFLKTHPSPGLPRRAAPEIARALRASKDIKAAAERMAANHEAWMRYWATLPMGGYIPQLWRWVQEGEWEIVPTIRKPMTKADWSDIRLSEKLAEMDKRRAEQRRRAG